MSAEWVIVLVIMLAMDVYMFLALWAACQRNESLVRKNFYIKLRDCDRLAERRLQDLENTERQLEQAQLELEELRQKKKELENAPHGTGNGGPLVNAGASMVKAAAYRNEDAMKQYRYIKDHVQLDTEAFVSGIAARTAQDRDEAAPYRKAKECLPFDAVVMLMGEDSERQLALSDKILTENGCGGILRDYLRDELPEETSFGILEFMDYLDVNIRNGSTVIWVYTGDMENPLKTSDSRVRWQHDGSINEGCRIRYRSQFFDYSL